MSTLNELASLYKTKPVTQEPHIQGNNFTDMILRKADLTEAAFDKLAWLAGIKNAPADAKYDTLDTSNLNELLVSARAAGYDVEVVNI